MEDHSMYLLEQKQQAGRICSSILVALPIPTNVSVVPAPSNGPSIPSAIQSALGATSSGSSSVGTNSVSSSTGSGVNNASHSSTTSTSLSTGPKTMPSVTKSQEISSSGSSILPTKSNVQNFNEPVSLKAIAPIKLPQVITSTQASAKSAQVPPTTPSAAKLDTSIGSDSSTSSNLQPVTDPSDHDPYCIICHQTDLVKKSKGSLLYCSKCPLSAHRKHFPNVWADGVCPECVTLESSKSNSKFNGNSEVLAQLLKHTVDILAEDNEVEGFDAWLKKHENVTTMKITFHGITEKVKDRQYKKIEQFEFDIRLFEHNLITTKNRRLTARKTFMARYKEEMDDIYTCHYCYKNFYNTDSNDKYYGFNMSCPEGHPVVWVYNDWFKVFWPAKVYKSLDPKFDYEFRFFGERKMENQKGNSDSEKVFSYSKIEPKRNERLMAKFMEKSEVNLKEELIDSMKCVKEYLKPFDYEISEEPPTSLPKVIERLKFLPKTGMKRPHSSTVNSKSSDSSSVASSSSAPSVSSKTSTESDDDCVILDNVKKGEARAHARTSDADRKETTKTVISTKSNTVKANGRGMKDMSYEDLLIHDADLRECIENLAQHLEKTVKNIEVFNENAFDPDLPTVKKLKASIEEHQAAIKEFPKRLCDSCQRNEVDLKFFCCQYGIYCCEFCQKDDRNHVKFCLKGRQAHT